MVRDDGREERQRSSVDDEAQRVARHQERLELLLFVRSWLMKDGRL